MTSSAASPAKPRRFATTRWSLVLQARQSDSAPARAALEELCQAYWLPVYAFMRRQTSDVHEAQDWTQGFFVSLLSHDAFAELHPDQGRFRSFLLAAARHFVSNERDYKSAAKRGGQVVMHSLDYEDGERQLANELARHDSPELIFERRWALALLDRVLNQLRDEYDRAGQSTLFQSLAERLSGHTSDESLVTVAQQLQMTAEAIRVALHRMRKRYRHLLRHEIAQTTDAASDVDDEMRHLFQVLSRPS